MMNHDADATAKGVNIVKETTKGCNMTPYEESKYLDACIELIDLLGNTDLEDRTPEQQAMAEYVTTVCTECNKQTDAMTEAEKLYHRIYRDEHGFDCILVGCEGYLLVNPILLGVWDADRGWDDWTKIGEEKFPQTIWVDTHTGRWGRVEGLRILNIWDQDQLDVLNGASEGFVQSLGDDEGESIQVWVEKEIDRQEGETEANRHRSDMGEIER